MDDEFLRVFPFECCRVIFRCVADLEGHLTKCLARCEEMKIVYGEVLLVGSFGIIAVGDVEDIVGDILLHHEPWSATEAHTLALTDGVEPQPFMFADTLTRFQLNHIARHLSQIATDIVIVTDLPQKANALRVLALGIHQMFALRYLTYLILHIVTNREECLTKLPVVDLSKEIRLIFYRVRTRAEPFLPLFIYFRLRIMTRGDEVVVVTPLLIEGTELNQPVAHHIGIGRQTGTHLFHRVGRHLIPVFLMTVDDLEFTAKLMRHSRRHLQILLTGTVPLRMLLRTYLDIKAIRVEAEPCKLKHHHTAVDTTRQQHRNPLISYLFTIQL